MRPSHAGLITEQMPVHTFTSNTGIHDFFLGACGGAGRSQLNHRGQGAFRVQFYIDGVVVLKIHIDGLQNYTEGLSKI